MRVVAVNVVEELIPGPKETGPTAIDKRPQERRVAVGELGLAGDRVCDTKNHGGPDQALYVYAAEDSAWWAAQLAREIPPGLFGENLDTEGLDITNALIGEGWRLGAGPTRRGDGPGAADPVHHVPAPDAASPAGSSGSTRRVGPAPT